MRKIKKINGYLVVKFNDREKRDNEGTGLGEYGVIDAELYTGHLDIDRGEMEYDGAGTLEEAVELARGLESEMDITEQPPTYTVSTETDESYTEEEVDPQLLINGWESTLQEQVKSDRHPEMTPSAATHELHGFKTALYHMGLLDGEEVEVDTQRFGPAPACCNFEDDGYRSVGILAHGELAALSPHDYQESETITGCTVQVLRCRRCGHESFAWSRTAFTADDAQRLRGLLKEVDDYVKDAASNSRFEQLPAEYDSYNGPVYRLGLRLETDCPDNDCRIFLNIFKGAREIDEALGKAAGAPQRVLLRELKKRDWGYAKDYVECMWLMLQHDVPEDFVIATGVQHTVREFTTLAFAHDGIQLEWQGSGIEEKGIDRATGRVLVEVSPEWFRPTDVDNLWGDPTKARTTLGWNPQRTSYEQLCAIMAEHDLKLAKKEKAAK